MKLSNWITIGIFLLGVIPSFIVGYTRLEAKVNQLAEQVKENKESQKENVEKDAEQEKNITEIKYIKEDVQEIKTTQQDFINEQKTQQVLLQRILWKLDSDANTD